MPSFRVGVNMTLLHELWAYTKLDSCRLAAILEALLPESTAGVERETLWAYWAQRYPQQKGLTGKQRISTRAINGFSYLKAARIAQPQGTLIVVRNVKRLKLAAANLQIVQDKLDRPVSPDQWSRRPAVPRHLLAIQEAVEAR